jgi:hypothetical protein
LALSSITLNNSESRWRQHVTSVPFIGVRSSMNRSRCHRTSDRCFSSSSGLTTGSFRFCPAIGYDACTSGDIARDPLCSTRDSTGVCYEPMPNPWIYQCRYLVSDASLLSCTSRSGRHHRRTCFLMLFDGCTRLSTHHRQLSPIDANQHPYFAIEQRRVVSLITDSST